VKHRQVAAGLVVMAHGASRSFRRAVGTTGAQMRVGKHPQMVALGHAQQATTVRGPVGAIHGVALLESGHGLKRRRVEIVGGGFGGRLGCCTGLGRRPTGQLAQVENAHRAVKGSRGEVVRLRRMHGHCLHFLLATVRLPRHLRLLRRV